MSTLKHQGAKTVVVHRGARDGYQVAAALSEAGLLESLVTDVYWPADRSWAQALEGVASAGIRSSLQARFSKYIPSSRVRCAIPSGPFSFALDKMSKIPFETRRKAQRWNDASLGELAGRHAFKSGSNLLSYSYYGYHAFKAFEKPGMLFQVHPHPLSVRRLLSEELAAHPDCASSLQKEWELSLPTEDFARLSAEARMASHFLCASSFTKQTLIENGADPDRISVVPYGVDAALFAPPEVIGRRFSGQGPLRLLFVGTINQRKGIKYLLQALHLLRTSRVELTVCGRVVDNLELFSQTGSQVQVRPSVSFDELRRAYQEADLFVFPSIVEGFAQVLLEALSSGLPILSTTHTAAPDLIDEGIQGYVVPPRRPDLLAERIDWLASHPAHLAEMKIAARLRASEFDWSRFRQGVVRSVRNFTNPAIPVAQALAHV